MSKLGKRNTFFGVIGKLLLLWIVLSMALVAVLRFINPPTWSWKIIRSFSTPHAAAKVQHQWVDLQHISPQMQLAVIASEDQTFPENFGFDIGSIMAAFEHNERSDQIRGASTITQQTAKNLFLWSSRSYFRKAVEAWFTFVIELEWDKSRTLEVYLNIIEFGPGIYGVEAAAQHYFQVPAAKLTAYQASLLAAILPNPWGYKIKPPSAYMLQRSSWIQQQMRQLGLPYLKLMD